MVCRGIAVRLSSTVVDFDKVSIEAEAFGAQVAAALNFMAVI